MKPLRISYLLKVSCGKLGNASSGRTLSEVFPSRIRLSQNAARAIMVDCFPVGDGKELSLSADVLKDTLFADLPVGDVGEVAPPWLSVSLLCLG